MGALVDRLFGHRKDPDDAASPVDGTRWYVFPRSTIGRWTLVLLVVTIVGSGTRHLLVGVWDQGGDDPSIAVVMSGLTSTLAEIGTLVCGLFALLRHRDVSVLVMAAVVLAQVGLLLPSG